MRQEIRGQRGTTLVEVLVAMMVLTIVALAIGFMFEQTVKHYAFSTSNLSSEQQSRIALTKVTNAMRQASLVVTATPDINGKTPAPIAVPSADKSPSNEVVFYQVASLEPSDLPTDASGEPVPCYNKVTISWASPNPVPSPPHWGSQIVEEIVPYDQPCQQNYPSPMPIANDVTSFTVTKNGGGLLNFQVDVQVTTQVRVDQSPSVYQMTSTVHPVMAGGS
jgi:prepilin-type N-terminal cleavage/methylation domain-containing protein